MECDYLKDIVSLMVDGFLKQSELSNLNFVYGTIFFMWSFCFCISFFCIDTSFSVFSLCLLLSFYFCSLFVVVLLYVRRRKDILKRYQERVK